MISRQWAILAAVAGAGAVAIAAIHPWRSAGTLSGPPLHPPSARPEHARATSPRPSPACPPEELSCGLQKPVISDGVRPFANENYGLSVTFPRGSAVCMTRSGDAPHGFFAIYGTDASCAERPELPPSFISIYAEFNATFLKSLAEVVPGDCRPLSGAVRRALGSRAPALSGIRSAACQTAPGRGRIEISVYAMAGRWREHTPPEARTPRIIYTVTLGTTPARIETDVARFREVLRSFRIRPA